MGKVFDALDDRLIEWIGEQHVCFVATAPSKGGHVNVSPKGHDSLRVLGPTSVAYLDLTGSGAETIAHTRQDGRITIMFCAFCASSAEASRTRSAASGSRSWRLASRPSPAPGAIITVEIERVQTSCGYSIPFMDYREERPTLQQWAARRGDDGLAEYWAERNATSIDGLAALDS